MKCNGLQTKIFQVHTSNGGVRLALRFTNKIAAGATKATKETHKSSIFCVNKDLKIMTTIVYSTRS